MNKKAWIITISKTDNLYCIKDNNQVVAILDSRYSKKNIELHIKIIHNFLFKSLSEEINKKEKIEFIPSSIGERIVGVSGSFIFSACKSEVIKTEDNSVKWIATKCKELTLNKEGKTIIRDIKNSEIYHSSKLNININNFFI